MSTSETANPPVGTPEPSNNGTPEPTDIDQVRDLLFGSYNRDYERRFRTLERQMEHFGGEIQRLNERVERQHNETQTQIRERFFQLQMRVEDVQRTLQAQMQEQQRETERRLEAMQQTLNTMFDQFDHNKVDQQDLAEMLLDLGARMKRAIKNPTT